MCAPVFFTADAECACVETASGSLQLYEWFAPIKETAVFRWYEPGKVKYTGYAVVYILLLRIHIAESRNTVPFSGWFQQDSHWGNASSPSPLNTQSMKGFLCRKSSLFPKNSGPPKMKQLLGSNAFNLAVMCNSCSWLNNHVVAAMMSGWCRYISSTIIPTFSLMVADTISHLRNCFCYLCVQCRECQRRVCIRAIEVYPKNFHV